MRQNRRNRKKRKTLQHNSRNWIHFRRHGLLGRYIIFWTYTSNQSQEKCLEKRCWSLIHHRRREDLLPWFIYYLFSFCFNTSENYNVRNISVSVSTIVDNIHIIYSIIFFLKHTTCFERNCTQRILEENKECIVFDVHNFADLKEKRDKCVLSHREKS